MRISKSDKTTVEASNWADTKKVFNTHGGDTQLNDRTGQTVTVIRPLTGEEADIADVGRMFKVRFEDGYVTDVFEDELSDIDNAPTVETDIEVVAKDAYEHGYTDGWKERFGEPNERPQGEWIDEGQYADYHSEHAYMCTNCGRHIIESPNSIIENRFCKYCGADMKKGGAENDTIQAEDITELKIR